MSVFFKYNPREKLVEVTCSGELTISEIMQYFEDLREDSSIEKGAIEIVDLSQIKHFNVDFKDASEMPGGYMPAHQVKEIRATILWGTNKLNEGLAHLIKAHFVQSLPDHTFYIAKSQKDALTRARLIHRDYNRGAC